MNEVKKLLALELRALFGINRFLHTKDPKEKRSFWLFASVFAVLLLVIFSYVGGLVMGLTYLGLSSIVPMYLVTLASLLVLFFGIFKAGATLFEKRNFDMITAMPLRVSHIVISRFLLLYIENTVFSLVVMLPGVIVFGILTRPSVLFYFLSLLVTLLLPFVPLVLSAVIGTTVTALSSGAKHKSLVETCLMTAFAVAVVVASFFSGGLAENVTLTELTSFADTVGEMIGKLYFPAVWLGDAMLEADLLPLLLYIAVAAVLTTLELFCACRFFQSIVRRMLSNSATHDYKMQALNQKGLLRTLYLREAKRYFSSGIYTTNTILGPIFGSLMCAFLAVTGTEGITNALPLPMELPSILALLLPLVFCMMTTTSVSISMEGKTVWAVKSLPIPTKTFLDSKILLNLSLIAPFFAISEVLLAVVLRPTFMEALVLLLLPLSVILFSVVIGITVDLKLHRFDWEKEQTVVKQSASAGLGGFAGPLLAIVLGALSFAVPARVLLSVQMALAVLVLAITAALYFKNNRSRLSAL